MTDHRTVAPPEDRVCGMTVDPEVARAKGLTLVHEGKEHASCGKGCMVEFGYDPDHFLNAGYQPSM